MNKLLFLSQIFICSTVFSQAPNNLVYPEEYKTSKLGTLSIDERGKGTAPMLLIADAGFDTGFFEDFISHNDSTYKFFVVTLPGNSINGYPLPRGSYSQHIWLESIDSALVNFINQKKLNNIIVAGHLTISTYLAMRFSIDHPEVVAGTIIFAGQPYSSWPSRKDPTGNTPISLEERAGSIDYFMAPRFYKTVTREQWNNGLYQPNHYSENSDVGEALYNATALVPIPLMAQLLCEYFTTDISLEFEKIKKPVLIMKPGFDEGYLANNPSHSQLFHTYWQSAESLPNCTVKVIPNARLAMGHTYVKELSKQISQFTQQNFK